MLAGNAGSRHTTIRVEARKSFTFALWIKDHHGRPLDISNTRIRLVVKKAPYGPDATANLIESSEITPVYPLMGYARVDLQASDLDHKPGEYDYSIVMLDRGYSTVLVKGSFDIVDNTEFESVNDSYANIPPVTALEIQMRGRNVLEVRTGPTLAPGTQSFSDADKEKLDSVEEGAEANVLTDWSLPEGEPGSLVNRPAFGTAAFVDVDTISLPPGGRPGEVLTKLSSTNFDASWARPTGGGGGGGSGLDPTGVPAGEVPTANGVDGWAWKMPAQAVTTVAGRSGDVVLNLNDVANSSTRVSMTPAERTKLTGLTATPSWTVITDKPTLGTASTRNDSYFLQPKKATAADTISGVFDKARIPKVSALNGFSSGTAVPSGGADGDIYFQITG